VREHGIPQVGPAVKQMPEFICPITEDKQILTDFVAAFTDFFARWRLTGLAAPGLPVPLQPLMAGVLPANIVRQLEDVGGIFFLPDTFPIPSRDELRWLLEDAIHGSDNPEHLAEWVQIVRASNLAKNKISMYARKFKVQHYWRILQQRHGNSLRRKTGKLEEVLAAFLQVKVGLMHQDLMSLRKSLGPDWYRRGWSAPAQSSPEGGSNPSLAHATRKKRKHK
jgi:hypothetical protein